MCLVLIADECGQAKGNPKSVYLQLTYPLSADAPEIISISSVVILACLALLY